MRTEEITINGHIFHVDCPYTEGHPCTATEAAILNRKLHAGLRANFSKIMDSMVVTPETMREVSKAFSEYASTYSLNGADPIELEARVIAEAVVRASIKAAGKNISDFSKSSISDQAKVLLRGDLAVDIYEQARVRVKAIQVAAKRELARIGDI